MDNNFEYMKNFRDLGGHRTNDGKLTKYGVFARCNILRRKSESDRARLLSLGFTHNLDLRTPEEVREIPDMLASEPDFTYINLKCDDWWRDSIYTPPECAAYYHFLLLKHDNIRKIFEYLADAPDGVFFHCYTGKDRAGTVAALLLLLADVTDDEIIDDYAESFGAFYGKMTEQMLSRQPLVPRAENMEIFLREFRRLYKDVDSYFTLIGLDRGKIDRLKQRLRQP